MKALSLWQPWATLIATEHKLVETRSWKTKYRGPIAIHSAKTKQGLKLVEEKLEMEKEIFHTFLRQSGFEEQGKIVNLPFGSVVCIVELKDVIPTEEAITKISPKELTFGNYSLGRYAWFMEMVKILKPPIPVKGQQGFWNWEEPWKIGL